MRAVSIIRAAVLAAAVTALPSTVSGASAKDVFAEAAASVVVVLALDEGGEITAQGSGVVVGEYEVVTNCHVLKKATNVAVRQAADWSGDQSYRMTTSLLARNDDRDLCLLFVEELPVPPAAKVIRLGAAKTLSVGEEVYAVGAPAGLELSLSRGVVSQLRFAFGKRSAPMVQTDAAISPGSSGGGLFNQAGELVGITSFKRQGENLNFAMPAEWVEELKAQGRQELTKASARMTCLTNPSYDCVIKLALQEANKSDSPLMRSRWLREIAETQAEVGDIRGAQETLRTLEVVSSIDEVDSDRSRALGKIARAQARAGDVTTAIETTLGISDDLLRKQTLLSIIDVQAEAGDFSDAMKSVMSIDDAGGRELGSLIVALWQLVSGDVHAAEQTIASVSWLSDDDETIKQFSAIIQAKKGNFAGALAIADSYDPRDQNGSAIRVALLNEIAVVQASEGDALGAKQTLESALITARGRDYARGRAVLVSTVAVAQARAGDIEAARQSVAEAAIEFESARKTDPSDSLLNHYLSDIAGWQAEAGFVAMGIETALGIREEDLFDGTGGMRLRVSALISIARHLAGKPPLPWWHPRSINFWDQN